MFTFYAPGFPYTLFHEVDVGPYLKFVCVSRVENVLSLLYVAHYRFGADSFLGFRTRREIYRLRRILYRLAGMRAVIDNHREHLMARIPEEGVHFPLQPQAG